MIDYKISQIIDNGRLTKVWYYVYEGEENQVENVKTKQVETRYMRSKRLEEGRLRLKTGASMKEILEALNEVISKDERQIYKRQ